jgi:hypothetical protein
MQESHASSVRAFNADGARIRGVDAGTPLAAIGGVQRSLWPREHGAYVQLLAPLATALAIAPTVPGLLFAAAACTGFLAMEAVMVARGARGHKRRLLDGARAAGRARLLGAIAIANTLAALVLAPLAAIQLIALVAIPTTLAVYLASRRALHTLGGELVAATALAGAAVPVAAAGGISRGDVLVLWAAWSIGFATTIVAVRDVIANHRARRDQPRIASALVALLLWLGIAMLLLPLTAIALPLAVASLVVGIAMPSAHHVRTIGIALACTSIVAGAVAVYLV